MTTSKAAILSSIFALTLALGGTAKAGIFQGSDNTNPAKTEKKSSKDSERKQPDASKADKKAASRDSAAGTTLTAQEAKADARASMKTDDTDYVIGYEDVLEISVWKNPDLSKQVVVRPDGMISLPLIGDVKASGLTPAQLKDRITDRLKEYQETVIASVIVNEVKSYRIFVMGEVVNPGTYTMTRKTSVLQAIALAGGFSPFASKNRIILVREKAGKNKPEKLTVRFDDIIEADEKNDRNLILRPGDTIFVP